MTQSRARGNEGSTSYARTVAAVAALGGFLFGYDTGVMSGALLFVGPEFDMTPAQEGTVTAMLLVGAAIGALTGGAVADALGRRRTLIVGGAIFVLGSVWCALAGAPGSLTAARFFLGLAVGAVSIVTPMYLSEMAPSNIRGKLVSLNTLMIVVGQLCAYLVNSALASTGSWRWMLGLAAVPGVALALGMCFLPETPLWLARGGKHADAARVASRVGVSREELDATWAQDAKLRSTRGQEWKALKANRWLQITVLIAAALGVTQQITGVNAIVYFAPTMMSQVGMPTENAIYTSIVIGVFSVVACWVGLQIIDRVGRKRLLLIGLVLNVVFLTLLSVIYRAAENDPAYAWAALACMAAFIASQQAAVSPTTWLLISELVPAQVRGLGMGLAGLALWVANWAVAQFFLPLVSALSAATTFLIFVLMGILAAGFVAVFVPETKRRSLADVAGEMERRYH